MCVDVYRCVAVLYYMCTCVLCTRCVAVLY